MPQCVVLYIYIFPIYCYNDCVLNKIFIFRFYILQSQWKQFEVYANDSRFASVVRELPFIVESSKSKSTIQKYKCYFNKFQNWCNSHSIQSLPASSTTVSLYIGGLIQQGTSVTILESSFYAIKWYHDFNFENNPCSNKILSLILEGGKRLLSKPVCKKDPITPDILRLIIQRFGDKRDLSKLRVCSLFLLGFSGFLRYNELSNIKMNNLEFHDTYLKLVIEKSKTDIYRRGSSVIIAKTGNDLCPIFWLKAYIESAGLALNTDSYIFRSISLLKSKGIYKLCDRNVPLSYTRAREILLNSLEEVGLDKSRFGLHSLRSGGATTGANRGISDRLIKIHGRWVTDRAKDGYIKDSVESQMAVSLNLGI